MAVITYIRGRTSYQVVHKNVASNDLPESYVATNDTAVSGLGGDFEAAIESDDSQTYTDSSAVHDTSYTAIGSGAIADFIYIEHSGDQEATKETETTYLLRVGLGSDTATFTLSPGESIVLHGLGTSCDNLSEIQLSSSSGDIYVKVISL